MFFRTICRSVLPYAAPLSALLLGGCAPAPRFVENPLSYKLLAEQNAAPQNLGHSPRSLSPKQSDTNTLSGETLDRYVLIAQVLRQNPTLKAAQYAIATARASYPAATAFKDLTIMYESAPATIGSGHPYGQMIKVTQPFEWPSNQELRGEEVVADTELKSHDYASKALQIASLASQLYDQYYVLSRKIDINREHTEIVARLRASAVAHYDAGHGSQQDPIQADVERELLERDLIELQAKKEIVVAEINALLYRPLDTELPPPPKTLPFPTIPETNNFHDLAARLEAAQQQPSIQAAKARIKKAEATLALRKNAFWPNFAISATYNSMWPKLPHQFMIGFSVTIPTQIDARNAAIDSSNANVAQSKAIYDAQLNQVQLGIAKGYLDYQRSIKEMQAFEKSILPTAKRRIEAAEAAFISYRTTFSDIIAAQRQLQNLRKAYLDVVASAWQARCKLLELSGDSDDLIGNPSYNTDTTPVVPTASPDHSATNNDNGNKQ